MTMYVFFNGYVCPQMTKRLTFLNNLMRNTGQRKNHFVKNPKAGSRILEGLNGKNSDKKSLMKMACWNIQCLKFDKTSFQRITLLQYRYNGT